jgi:hypothetical protein
VKTHNHRANNPKTHLDNKPPSIHLPTYMHTTPPHYKIIGYLRERLGIEAINEKTPPRINQILTALRVK